MLWNESTFLAELKKDLRINASMDPVVKNTIITIIKDNWDSFCEEDASRPMLFQ